MPTKEVAAVVLAAGSGRRLGGAKLLLPLDDTGRTLLDAVLEAVTASRCSRTLLVSGAYREQVEAVAARHQVACCYNPHHLQGQSTSLRAGLQQLAADPGPPAALFVLADQPGLSAALIDRLLETYRHSGALIVRPLAPDGQPANPVLFDPLLFAELAATDGDRGGREVARRHLQQTVYVPVSDWRLLRDIDTEEDYQRLRGRI